ncbi:glycosyl transferase, family 25 [Solimonas aquatica]|uniref:Glycosyl transferase, family 25 n=2 Tax=Solimonas aquatica TaxID=489703 RepID=A0A1H9CMA7_9GAMM|nr:glycosyl transferase, family 25 [Solimonas aquatica]
MRQQLDGLGLDYEFFKATDASRGELAGVSRYDEAQALWKLGHPLSPGELGCFASHYRLWQLCASSGEPLVIMEDDISITPEFVQAFAHTGALIAQYHLIRLCGLVQRKRKRIRELGNGHQLIRYLKGPFGTQCYALSPQGARALLAHSQVWIDAVDMVLDAFWTHGLACYAIVPYHIRHDEPGVTPASLIGNSRFEQRRSLARRLRRKLTRMGDHLQRDWFNLWHRD